MRLLFDFNDIPQIEEFTEFDAVPTWMQNSTGKESNADGLFLSATRAGQDPSGDYIGEWKLDGTPETYQAALQNYMEIVNQLLTAGYIKASDFKNFEWY